MIKRMVLILLSVTILRAEIKISPEIDLIQSTIDSINGSLNKNPYYAEVMYFPVQKKIAHFKKLMDCNLVGKEKIMMIMGDLITIYQLQENQLTSELVQRSDAACVVLLKNIRSIRLNKQQLFKFQQDLFRSRNSLEGLSKELCNRIVQEPSRSRVKPVSQSSEAVCLVPSKGTLAYLERKD